jgi:hypothetical protein
MLKKVLILLLVVSLAGCSSEKKPEYPYDDLLRLNHIQTKGTHNSYHIAVPDGGIPKYDYSHVPIDEQLTRQGVRQFELDVYHYPNGEFVVYHNEGDDLSTCTLLTDCLQVVKDWSDAHPDHHTLFIHIEPKEDKAGIDPELFNQSLDDKILSVWPRERIVTPDDVQGAYPTMKDALIAQGWPTLGETRGKVLFIMLDMTEWRDSYTRGLTSTAGRVLFAESIGDLDMAAFVRMDIPVELEGPIREAVENKNLIVRTRADSAGTEARENDYSRLEKALEIGAHLISTDFPAEVDEHDYWVEIPDGTPSRCNPLSAPDYCTSKAIENPTIVFW